MIYRTVLKILAAFMLFCSCARYVECSDIEAKKEVVAFLNAYCTFFSAEDDARYKSLFYNEAKIACLDEDSKLYVLNLDEFIESQIQYFKNTSFCREKFKNISVSVEGDIAKVSTDYELIDSSDRKTGRDYFTLVKTEDGWKILFLTFTVD